MPQQIELQTLHPKATFLRVLGVNYFHISTENDGELYLTEHGVPFYRQLTPQNWYENDWFVAHRQRLIGTGTVYRVPTRPIDALTPKSMDIVVKWSRVGQDVPLDTFTLYKNCNAEFNSPFEEFSLLQELRNSHRGPRILTQKPLGIFIPPERMQLWQTGRSREKVRARIARHPTVEIDLLRSYIMLFGWIDGIDAPVAYQSFTYDEKQLRTELDELTNRCDRDLRDNGFMVADHKPTHMIVRLHSGKIRRDRAGKVIYGLVDYELLTHTSDRRDSMLAERRKQYLRRQSERLNPQPRENYPAQLTPLKVFDLPYVYGRVESTGGALWVVGCDPELFPYFLPERWHHKQVKLSETNQVYYAQTKDRIHIVWKVSRVGEIPTGNPDELYVKRRLMHGYNAPFEEFSLAIAMQRAGLTTIYPRAIYMTGSAAELEGVVLDERRFQSMRDLMSPEGKPVLPMDHDFVLIYGYFRGLDDQNAIEDQKLWTPIDAAQAVAKRIIEPEVLPDLLARHADKLAQAGFEDLNLKPDHVLLCYIPAGPVKQDSQGQIATCHCNFEFVRKISR